MFNGFLVKIDGVQVPNDYIVADSYSASSEPIVISDYYDADYNYHIDRAPRDKIEVQFNTRVMPEADYQIFSAMIQEEMELEYYNTYDGLYYSGIFTYDGNITPTIYAINNNKVYFKEQTIKFVRKRAD